MNSRRYPSAYQSLLGLALALLASCNGPGARTPNLPMPVMAPQAVQVVRSTLLPGDSVEIFVLEDEKFNGTYKLRETGDIIMAKVGRIRLSGLTVAGAQDAVRSTLEGAQLKTPTVILDRVSTVSTQSFEERPKMLIYVAGSVAHPGQHMIAQVGTQPIMAYEALLIAGGTTAFADETHAFILRRGKGTTRTEIPLNLREIRQGKGSDVPLQEGDLITVPERKFGLHF